MPNGLTAGESLRRFQDKEDAIREKMDLQVVWECEIKEQLKNNVNMTQFFERQYDTGPIYPRNECFFGGRTENLKLWSEVTPGYKISYKDFNSLYPYVCFTTLYPIKHPKVRVVNQPVYWTKALDNPYKGLLKVKVIPPQKLRIPVLPLKVDDRLLFCLCRTCAVKHPHGGRIPGYTCNHNSREREFVTTCTHIELNAALDDGYIVDELYRVWEYEEWSDDLFKPYIRDWMTIKIHSSGWPSECKDSEKEQQRFIDENMQLFGMKIQPELMKRAGSKLGLNCLWGRFSLRNKLSKTQIITSTAELAAIMDDYRLEINSIDHIDDDTLMVTTTEKDEFVKEHPSSNIIVSLWTTSAARLLLLGALKKVAATNGAEVLYMDTDSVIYKHPEDKDPLPSGWHFGEMTDEVPENLEIVEFVSGGPKNYALKTRNKQTGKFTSSMKIRGLTLNYSCRQILSYDTFRHKVKSFGLPDTTPVVEMEYPNFIKKSRLGMIIRLGNKSLER
jgi:hypothetical protein